MKRILSLLLVAVLIFSFAACKPLKDNSSDETTTAAEGIAPVVSLKCDVTEVAQGDRVSVMLHIGDAPLTACFDICVLADEKLIYDSSSTMNVENLILAGNYMEEEKYVAVRGMVASTLDITDNDICEITYKVSEDAVSGDKITISTEIPEYQVGGDEKGNEIYPVQNSIVKNDIVLTVK